ncbi:MAG: hypothetical protein JSR25_10620 [Proteobacteria bacterium]|nr:hypothetical protein [Pseudomonadota bacterium]
MRYYFNVIDGQVEISDSEGADLPDAQAAHKEAFALASELRAEFPGQFQPHSVLEVISETGQRVFALPIAMPSGADGK